ncbi:hypothetical protein Poli38472_005583 [Pythium oligandrum]|uniref:Uncharacterized protein n=1 Tax=Pythium oligandrum TaxID=41045 RepID=A0A8K1CGT2_PYTOL|nr:hypothetical protein Poli38472_005583 [Pythium oligandrum]|eukprot:TMW62965.1 hypothetical protein Poli38472_005583 [Pythium oligandrum]
MPAKPTPRAAVVKMQEVLRVPAVDSYVRNFQNERHLLQDILEITLCYGIHCLARNFQLKGITVAELHTITKHEKTKRQDFYVRNATSTNGVRPSSTDPQQLYPKPSHSWRDGDHDTAKLLAGGTAMDDEDTGLTEAEKRMPTVEDVYFLPNAVQKDTLDEIDYLTKLMGKPFMDTAWTTYSGRSSSYLNKEQLAERMLRVDQRKRAVDVPEVEFPVCSFVEFVNAYVQTCVKQGQSGERPRPQEPEDEPDTEEHSANATIFRSRQSSGVPRKQTSPTPEASARSTPRGGGPQRNRSLHEVKSKIQPELQARREKILRVKKNQTQLMKESLARARLAEYEARRAESAEQKQRALPRRMPLDKITSGAAALEIVDDFMKSPLMDKFGSNEGLAQPRLSSKDPLKEELYGTAARDDDFIGCTAPPSLPTSHRSKQATTNAKRDYSGWLGDFGPNHTKTVRSVWETDVSHDAEERSASGRQSTRAKPLKSPTRFEWSFSAPDDPTNCKTHSKARSKDVTPATRRSSARKDSFASDSASEDWSESRSDASDPVYRWLKTAV